MAGKIDQIAARAENGFCAACDLGANLREFDLAAIAFHEFDAERFLEVANLHRERRLADRTFLRRAAKMLVARERVQITELAKADHTNKIFLSSYKDNRLDLM
jgi:hypothetical protein